MAFEKPVVVIDNGSYSIKAGFSCDNHPVSIIRTIVGRPENLRGTYGRDYYDVFVGDEAWQKRADLELSHPVREGRIVHWDNMERIWHHVYYRELKVAPEDRAVMFTCSPLTPMQEKIKCCEVFFETLNAPALCAQSHAVLAMYGAGLTTGLSVDLGQSTALVCPVYEGGLVSYAAMSTGLGGVGLASYVADRLAKQAGDYGVRSCDIVEDILRNYCHVTTSSTSGKRETNRPGHRYTLPDGKILELSDICKQATEQLFLKPTVLEGQGQLMSLQEAVVTSALKCDAELRNDLFQNIVPCGGLASLPGLNDRLQSEVEALMRRPVALSQSSEASVVSWLGGATFAGLSDAQKMWVTQEKFQEHGANIVRNKFL